MRLAVVVLMLLSSVAHADDDDLANVLIGPVFGLRISGPKEHPYTLGFEGGVGYGPERINLGFVHRSDHDLAYLEFDPWYLLGGSFGVAIDENGDSHGLVGVWEGGPLLGLNNPCTGWNEAVTLAGGYRYMAGIHELFVTVKAGYMRGNVCFD